MNIGNLLGNDVTAQVIRAGLADKHVRLAWSIALRNHEFEKLEVTASIEDSRAFFEFSMNGEFVLSGAFNMPLTH